MLRLENFTHLLITEFQSWAQYLQIWWDTYSIQTLKTLLIFLFLWGFFRGLRLFLIQNLKAKSIHTTHVWYERLVTALCEVTPWLWRILALYLASFLLPLPDFWYKSLSSVLIILGVFQSVQVVYVIVELLLLDNEDNRNQTAIGGIKLLTRIVLWVTGLVLVLANLGFDILGLVTSMGIVGIAVALAVQNILEDLFASFSIYFDKPFKVGDYIDNGNVGGTVKEIGLKTTRIVSLLGEEIVLSNRDLTTATIHNYDHFERRRTTFTLRIHLQTPADKIELVDDIVKKAIESFPQTEFGFGNFMGFEEWFLKFDFAYHLNSSEWDVYVNTHEKINIEILRGLEKAGIKLAIPSRSIYMQS